MISIGGPTKDNVRQSRAFYRFILPVSLLRIQIGYKDIHPTLEKVTFYFRTAKDMYSLEIDDKMVEDTMDQQLLCYLQLLETTKPFILNITRMPGK